MIIFEGTVRIIRDVTFARFDCDCLTTSRPRRLSGGGSSSSLLYFARSINHSICTLTHIREEEYHSGVVAILLLLLSVMALCLYMYIYKKILSVLRDFYCLDAQVDIRQ